jgi:cell division protein FtsB
VRYEAKKLAENPLRKMDEAKLSNHKPAIIENQTSIERHHELLPVYLLVEKEKKRHQAAIERMLQSNKRKDLEINNLKEELQALRSDILTYPIVKFYLF